MHYHLIGIAGTAMASLAGLLKSAGHTVTGSDENVYPPMSIQLQEMGIPYYIGFGPQNLHPRPDWVVVGNAISRGNSELECVLNDGIPYTSAASVLKEEFIRRRRCLAVSGTHGKTTTASLLAWVLECAGLNPSFMIGGIVENFGASYRLTDSPFFVIEADEYDTAYFDKGPKMWHYLPEVAIVNNVEFDHADIYRDEEAYKFAFARFINLIPGKGLLVAGSDSPLVRELAPKSFAPVQYFEYSEGTPSSDFSDWSAYQVEYSPEGTRFSVLFQGKHWGEVVTPLVGAFNVRNCLAVIAAASAVGAGKEGILEGLGSFRSVKRRMEVVGVSRGVTVLDDFAHHPTAVRETLAAIRAKYPGKRIVAVFEPRSYTAQRREFQEAYIDAFKAADEVILAGLARPERYTKETALDPEEMVRTWINAGKPASYLASVEEILGDLVPRLQGNEVVAIMSNGGFGGIHRKLLDRLV